MYDATDNIPTDDEIVAAVIALRERRDALLEERDDLASKLLEAMDERDRLRERLAEREDDDVKVFSMQDIPGGRDFAFLCDLRVLVVSPTMDAEREARLIAQLEARPELTTCDICSAPLWLGQTCTMHDAPEAGVR